MKKHIILVIALIGCCIFGLRTVYAVTATPSPTAPAKESKEKINDLMERLATKVAELKQSQRMAIYGTVKTVELASISVETKTKDVKIELTDDIKVIQELNGKRSVLKTENIDKGDSMAIFGDYDAGLDLMKAKVLFIQNNTVIHTSGTVTEVNKKNFTITLKTALDAEYIVDFEKFTKANAWTKDKEIEKSGFSKIISGQMIFVTGYPVPNKTNQISAARILTIDSVIKPSATAAPSLTGTPVPTEKTVGTIKPTIKATITPTVQPSKSTVTPKT